MRIVRQVLFLTVFLAAAGMLFSQTPAAGTGGRGQRGASGATAAAGGRGAGGRGGGRAAIAQMTMLTTAWTDGGQIPLRYTQAGSETSPGVQWSGAPLGTQSFVLIFHDIDAPGGNGLDDMLHWLVWNIPATATQIAVDRPNGLDLPDGGKQISVSGTRYRGPAASAGGPVHHYVMELYALDTMLQVEPAVQAQGSPNPGSATRAAVLQAMAGHIRGKASYVGLFRRPQ